MLARHPDWQLAFEDEVWWSRLAQPNGHAWTQDKPLRLLQKEIAKTDAEPKALACYGVLLADSGQMLLRFVSGRPISALTCTFLGWLTERMQAAGKRALVLIWDNASWHLSKEVKTWLKAHNRRAKQEGTCRLLVCFLPSKSPWLNNIEPKWVHGKRAITEPASTLTATQLKERVCAYYRCEIEPTLALEPC